MTQNNCIPPSTLQEEGVYEVYSMCFGRAPERRVHENFLRRDMHDGPMPLDFNVWILRNAHRTVLVDTGFGQRAAKERRRSIDFDPVEGLNQIGIDADSIEDIFLTHLHFDHAGNIDRFKKAKFHVQDAEVTFATGRCMCESHLRFPFDVEDVVALVRHTYTDRVCFHDGDAEPLPGISLHVVPGHTQGIQAVKVMTPRGHVLLASDSTHFYANLLRRSPFSVTVDAMTTLRSYDKLKSLAGSIDRLIPGHDPRVRDLYPSVTYAGIELTVLHVPPRAHDIEMLRSVNDEKI
jgi:glyoxylase-like metal-dependent hydrolase (beta-lactamase superfamily II)